MANICKTKNVKFVLENFYAPELKNEKREKHD